MANQRICKGSKQKYENANTERRGGNRKQDRISLHKVKLTRDILRVLILNYVHTHGTTQ